MDTAHHGLQARRCLIGGMAAMLALGMIYGWSVFVEPLEQAFGWVRSETALVFSICMASFYTGSFLAGFLSRKFSNANLVRLAGAIMACGFFFVSRTSALWHVYLFYGTFCGFATGMAYNAILAAVSSWFPAASGRTMGLLLFMFGCGGLFLGTLAAKTIQLTGWSAAFILLGVIVAGVCWAVSPLIRSTPRQEEESAAASGTSGMTPGQMYKSRQYWGFAFWSFCVCCVGYVQFAHAAPAVTTVTADPTLAAVIAGILSVSNGFGRIVWGMLMDRKGAIFTLTASALTHACGMACMTAAISLGSVFLIMLAYALGGLCYGGFSIANPAYIRACFGARNFQMNFGAFSLVPFFSAFVGPYTAGVLFEATQSYAVSSALMVPVALLALLGVLIIARADKKKPAGVPSFTTKKTRSAKSWPCRKKSACARAGGIRQKRIRRTQPRPAVRYPLDKSRATVED